MNIAFFLTPKREIVYESIDATMRQVLERMEHHRYTSIPLVNREGKYVGAINEGDLLRTLMNSSVQNLKDTNKILIRDIKRSTRSVAVSIDANIEDLITLAKSQNFVPVVDDDGIFIGIIKRSDIINYCAKLLFENKRGEDNIE